MGVVRALRGCLTEPELIGLEPDSDEFTIAHRQILLRKPLARRLFTSFCERCVDADRRYFSDCSASVRLELGSGVGVMKTVDDAVLTSEVKQMRYVDIILRAEELPFAPGTLRAVYAVNVFHHVPDAAHFFRSVSSALAPGGGLVAIEPYYGALARLVFRYLFTNESYEPSVATWSQHAREQVASGANQALSYVVLKRDREKWQQQFPELELVLDEPHTYLSYLLTGGLNFRQVFPDPFVRLGFKVEARFRELASVLALQHTLVIRKRR